MGWQGVIKAAGIAINDTTAYNLVGTTYQQSAGGQQAAVWFYDVTSIGVGDTWTLTLTWESPAGISITVASIAVTATGRAEISPSSVFTDANRAIPRPTTLTATLTTPGAAPALTFAVMAAYAG